MLPRRTPSEWLSSLPTLLVLLMAILMATGETLHSRLLQIGQHTWDDYFRLRVADQRPEPLCADVQTFEAQVQAALAVQQAQAAADPFADLLGDGASEADVRRSLEAALQQCQQQRSAWLSEQARVTPGLAAYRQLEAGVALVVAWTGNHRRFMLAALLVLCAAMAALHRHHIALRPIQSVRDYRVATGAQLLANALLTLSAVVYRAQEAHSQQQGVEVAFFYLHHLWIAGFSGLTLVSAWQLWKTPADLDAGGHWGRALLSIPLYSLMCISAAVQFAWHGFYHGISVYLSMMAELSSLFLNLALYVWVGMLLTRTRLAIRVFDVLRPWQLSPPLLCTVVLLIAALPTAYTGASGIFIMAAGVTLYQELRRGGVSEPLALATTAMSGSMGVVLRPCLLVVIVATLNNTVTTQELFTAGVKVFLLSLVLFLLVALLLRESGTRPMASPREALPASLRALRPLLPYVLIFAAVVLFFRVLLQRGLDEFSAPVILPLAMLAILAWERWADQEAGQAPPVKRRLAALERDIRGATSDATGHIGALLMLMALSVSMGGLIERSGMLDLLPATLSSIWLAMAALVVILVIVGMIMDPYGAVILVNATLAPLAFRNGIEPLHFWLLTLVAFELGYLTPPVALNHLLTRQVVRHAQVPMAAGTVLARVFWRRHVRYVLPILVMGSTLLIVAFTPLLWPDWHDWLFVRIQVAH